MKPYSKTFRVCKLHKAKDCGICAERVARNKKGERRKGKEDILNGLPDESFGGHLDSGDWE